ncbi:hypothetical protein STANM309S_03436 [Streptomyces tanashiensis]
MPWSASSARRHSLSISTAAFEVLYAGSAREGWKAAAEAVLTMWPPWPRAVICAPKRQPWMTPHRLTSRTRFHSSAEVSKKEPVSPMPASLTRTSTTPYSLATFAASFSIACSSATSTVSPQASGAPIRRAMSAVRAAPSASRSTATTRAPASAKAKAVARPMPLAAPVTRTSWPPNRSAYAGFTPLFAAVAATGFGAFVAASSSAGRNSAIQADWWVPTEPASPR